MSLYQFMENNPWLTFFLVAIVACTITEIVGHIAKAFNRKDKSKNQKDKPQ